MTSTRNEVAATANLTGSELVKVSHLPWSVPAKLVATASAGITSPSAITAATVCVQPGIGVWVRADGAAHSAASTTDQNPAAASPRLNRGFPVSLGSR